MKTGYLGPRTNSEIALEKLRGNEKVPFARIEEVFNALLQDSVERILIPVRNSLTGEIVEHVSEINKYKLKVLDELVLPIVHCFGVARRDIGFIASHRQALLQCRSYLDHKYPGIYREECPSTEAAAKLVGSIRHGAVIAPRETCLHYSLNILEENIVKNNISVFYVCSK